MSVEKYSEENLLMYMRLYNEGVSLTKISERFPGVERHMLSKLFKEKGLNPTRRLTPTSLNK